MTSLADVYEGLGEEATRRQLYAGTGLFVVGAALLVAGIVVATTGVLSPLGFNAWQSWEPAGVLAGLGLPAVFLGIFTVLPANREVRAAAIVGASVAVLGVTLFAHAYPTRWIGNTPNLTPLVTLVYFLGAITTFWCLFTAVATFQSRNDPGGTVKLEVTRGGETRVVEVDRADLPGSLDGTVADGGSATGQSGGHADVTLVGDADRTPGTNGPATAGTSEPAAVGTSDPASVGRGASAEATDGTAGPDGIGESGGFGGSDADAGDQTGGSWGLADTVDSGSSVGSEVVDEPADDFDGGSSSVFGGESSSAFDDESSSVYDGGPSSVYDGGSSSAFGGGSGSVFDSGSDGTDADDARSDEDIAERTAGAVRPATDAVGEGSDRPTAADAGTGETPTPASDGGATSPGIRTPADDAEVLDSRSDPADTTDSYCGNCTHFKYVQTSRGIRPFCELDDGIMDDVDACDRWEPNRLK